MLVLLDRTQAGQPTRPEWLEGWDNVPRGEYALCHRATADGHLVGVAIPLVFNPAKRWASLEDGWQIGITGRFDPAPLIRDQHWFDVRPVADLKGRTWMAPVILTPSGSRDFAVSYGVDWLPALTDDQARAEKIARAALDAALSGKGDLDMATACQWAAELLALTHHLSVRAIAALGLMDDALALGVLNAAVSSRLFLAVENE